MEFIIKSITKELAILEANGVEYKITEERDLMYLCFYGRVGDLIEGEVKVINLKFV